MAKIEVSTAWKSDMEFVSHVRGHSFIQDTSADFGGKNTGPTPKEYLAASISGCSAMDVISILKKMRENVQSLEVKFVTETTATQPAIFGETLIQYIVNGPDIKPANAIKAVNLSMTKYCGVSAMVSKTVTLKYNVILNGENIHQSTAQFNI